MDHSQGEHQARRNALQGCRTGGLRGGGGQGTITGSIPLGFYTYFKKLDSGEARAATVEVYLLRVKERLKKWPERSERKVSWVSTKEAVRLVEEPGVVPLLLRVMELEDDLARPPPASKQ